MDIRCPNCGTTFKVAKGECSCVKPVDENATGFLIPETIRNDNIKGDKNMNMTKKEERMAILKSMGFDTEAMLNAGIDLSQFVKDDVTERIKEDGHLNNRHLFKRFVAAQYIDLLGWRRSPLGKDHFADNFNMRYSYQYQFDFSLKVLNVLAHQERDNDPELKVEEQFFNKDIFVNLLRDYCNKLEQHLKSWKTKKCKGIPYIKYKGENIFVEDIGKKIISPMYGKIWEIRSAKTYAEMYSLFRRFIKSRKFTVLPYSTKKCDEWVDCFKGRGAFYTAQNLIRFSDCKVHYDYLTLEKEESERELNARAQEYSGEFWRLHAWTKKLIKDNNFSLEERLSK